MRVAWVSFDVIGRECLEAAAACGAEVVAVVTLEAVRAAAALGVSDYVHLDLPDMRLDTIPHAQLNAVAEEQVRDFRPGVVYTVHPDVNRDHRESSIPSPWRRAPCPGRWCAAF